MREKKERRIREAIHQAHKLLVESGSHIVGIVSFKDLYQTAKEITPMSLSEFKFMMRKIHVENPLKYAWSRSPELMIDKRYRIEPNYWGFSIKEKE